MQSDNNRNMIIAIALSLVVVFGWQFFISGPQLEQAQKRAELAQQQATADTSLATPAASRAKRARASTCRYKVSAGSPTTPPVALMSERTLYAWRSSSCIVSGVWHMSVMCAQPTFSTHQRRIGGLSGAPASLLPG